MTGIQKGGLLPTPSMQVGHQVEPATQAAILAAQKLLQSQLNQVNQPATVPSFYNQTAVNTSRIAEQMQKRKLLWANKVLTSSLLFFCVIIINRQTKFGSEKSTNSTNS